MSIRTFVAFAVVLGLTAVAIAAPAPTEKTQRKKPADDLGLMSGTWKLAEQGRLNMGGFGGGFRVMRRGGENQTKIRIENEKFTYLYFNGRDYQPSTSYELKLQQNAAPKAIDLTYQNGDYTIVLKGIYKIEGNKLTLLYVQNITSKARNIAGQEQERPTSFENPLGNVIQMVLEKE